MFLRPAVMSQAIPLEYPLTAAICNRHRAPQSECSCFTPGVRVLRGDLKWVAIETLAVGDEVIGFDDQPISGRRVLRRTAVTKMFRRVADVVRVRTTDGVEMVVTPEQFGQEPLEELARSIQATGGVLEPIVVRPNGNGGWQIVAGERRWRASKIAEMGTIRGIVRDVSDRQMALLSLVENLVRKDLNVAEEGRYLEKLLQEGVSWNEICESLGTERQYLEWKVDVVQRCTDQVVWLIKQGTLSGSMGWRLSKLSANGQARFLREVNQRPMTVQEQIGLVNAIWADENQVEMFPEVKLTEEQVEAARSFQAVLDKAISAAIKLERLEGEKPGTVGTAMATQLDMSVQKIGNLVGRLNAIQRGLQRRQGQMAVAGKEAA